MKLSLLERVVLGSVLPKEGKYEDLIVKDDIMKKVSVTQDEVKDFEITSTENGGIQWNNDGAVAEFDIDFTELETALVKKSLEKLNEAEKLNNETVGLFKKFCK